MGLMAILLRYLIGKKKKKVKHKIPKKLGVAFPSEIRVIFFSIVIRTLPKREN
jgi:hypothetical protein